MANMLAARLPFDQRPCFRCDAAASGESTPRSRRSSAHVATTRSGSPHSQNSTNASGEGADQHWAKDSFQSPRGAKTPAVLWASTPTPGGAAESSSYSFALPPGPTAAAVQPVLEATAPLASTVPQHQLSADADVFIPVRPLQDVQPVQASLQTEQHGIVAQELQDHTGLQVHAEAQAVMMAEAVLNLESPTGSKSLTNRLLRPSASGDPHFSARGKRTEILDVRRLPSKGSIHHSRGQCRPCAWMWKPRGCQNDFECDYCHLCPEGELKNRKKMKVTAIRMGALAPSNSNASGSKGASHRDLKLANLL
eukprot:TRINITY_DN16529_c0_g1_i2.p1 TRINITY_DN16529_c0_g1~~TRINITY_DN16529_c0_g1_i2.p1  ORF type:complete len:336 (+),score=55.77 TRINITY_DN16529_c0_g1_i2:82-1008(+)